MTGKKRSRGGLTSPVGGLQSASGGSTSPMGSIFLSDSGSRKRASARVRNRGVTSKGSNLKFIKKFKLYLQGHCGGITDAMWDINSFEMQIPFSTIRASHKELSDDIVLKQHKMMETQVHSALVHYLTEQFTKKDFGERYLNLEVMVQHIKDHAKLNLVGVPDRIEPIEVALDLPIGGCPNKRSRLLFAKHPHRSYRVPIATDVQLMTLVGAFDHLTASHKQGRSWGGNWTKKHWDIADGKPCLFAPAEPGEANQNSCKLDLNKFAIEFLHPFKSKNQRYPANMESLINELTKPLDLPDHEFFGWYYEFLAFHPCFFTGSARRMLVTWWYHLVEYLHYDEKPEYVPVFGHAFAWTYLLDNQQQVDPVLWLVYSGGKKKKPYFDTIGHLFRLIRQIQEHAYRNTKLIGDVQTIEMSDETDLYAEDQYPFALSDLIKLLFIEHQMVGEFLDCYEDFKKLRGPPSRRGG